MFTGIIEATGTVERIFPKSGDLSLRIHCGAMSMDDVQLGDSIAVNGVCLTVVRFDARSFDADVSRESLAHTRLAEFKPGTRVNLEKALTLSTRLGGHLVSGHVDGLGKIVNIARDGRSWRYEIQVAEALLPYIAEKGSITVDGASLTVTGLVSNGFCLNIVPHTMANSIIEDYDSGTHVHVEVDLIARYTERLLGLNRDATKPKSGIDAAFLLQNGFGRGR